MSYGPRVLHVELKRTESISLTDTHLSNVPSIKIPKGEIENYEKEKEKEKVIRPKPKQQQSICKLNIMESKMKISGSKESLSIDNGISVKNIDSVVGSPFHTFKLGSGTK